MNDSHALALVNDAPVAVAPAVTPQAAREAMTAYLELCEAVLTDDDYQEFTQRKKVDNRWVNEKRRFKKKSAVKKLQTFFNVTVHIKDTTRDDLGDGHFGFRVIATAQTPGGREVEATGACSTHEERFDLQPFDDESSEKFAWRQRKALARAYHDVLSTAETRATNRCVMNCIGVGGGEVTADEIQRQRPDPTPPAPPPSQHRKMTPQQKAAINGMRDRFSDDEKAKMLAACGITTLGKDTPFTAAADLITLMESSLRAQERGEPEGDEPPEDELPL